MALQEAALSGIGVISQPEPMLDDDLAEGRLVRLFPDWPAPSWPVQLVHLASANIPPKLESFIQFLQETVGRDW